LPHRRDVPSRGVARRNAKLRELRSLVAQDRAVLAVDLASGKQAAVVLDHDSVVLARRMFTGSAWCISQILAWAQPVAAKAGYAGLVLACEPTGHRWKPLVVTARAAGIAVVCVQPLLVHRGREGEDYTRNRSDFDDAVIIGRLTADLRCYVPYLPEGPWARLRHLGARRAELLVRATAARQCLRDLLECAWPTVLNSAAEPLESATWRAALAISAQPEAIAAMSEAEFLTAVQAQVKVAGGQRICRRIARAVHAAAACPGGIAAERDAALERAEFARHDWMNALAAIAEVEARMVAVLDQLHLTHLIATIPGLSAVSAAAILAETGDPPVQHAPGLGQACRARAAGQRVGELPRPDPHLRPRKARPAHRGLARDLGRPAAQPGVVCLAWLAHQPRCQPARRRAGPRRRSRRAAAPAVRRHHQARAVGPGHRRRNHHGPGGDHHRRLMTCWWPAGGANPMLPWVEPVSEPGRPARPRTQARMRPAGQNPLAR
jgi:transposase